MEITKVDSTYYEIKEQRLDSSSMLRMFNILKDENDIMFMNIFKNVQIGDSVLNNIINFETMTITNIWWENISYQYYGSLPAWWILCLSNKILNPFEEMEESKEITALKTQFIPLIHRDMERIFDL